MSGARPLRDVRLVVPAAATWAGTAIGDLAGPRVAAGCAACAGMAVVGAVVAIRRCRRGPVRAGAVARVLALAAACAGLATAVAVLRAPVTAAGPLTGYARHHLSVTADVVVTSDPQRRTGRSRGTARAPELTVLHVVTRRLHADGGQPGAISVRVPLLVVATGAGWDTLLPSQHLTVTGRLAPTARATDGAATLFARGSPAQVGAPSAVQRGAGRLRAGLRAAAGVLPRHEQGLLPGLVDGDVSEQTEQVREDFRTTGLTHLTAVSGANVAIVAAAALGLARAVGLGLRARSAAAVLAVLGFVVLARPSPSVVRAAVMGLLGVAALASGRSRIGVPTLAAAVLLLVLVDPALAVDDGFVLSVLATGALLVLAPTLRERMLARVPRWCPVWLVDGTAIAVAAQVATAPYIAVRFARLSLLSVPANLLAAPAVAPATVLGVVAAVLAPLSLSLARVAALLAGVPVGWLVTVSHLGAALPGASVGWPRGVTGLFAVAGAAAGAAALARHPAARRPAAVLAAGAIAGTGVVHALPSGWPPAGWAVVVCDVGQGDGVVLASAPGAAVVVDAGPDPARIDRCLRRLGVRRVPVLVLTHFHADHVEGVPGVLRHRSVGAVLASPLAAPAEEHARVKGWLARARLVMRVPAPGEVQGVGAVRWEVLGPAHAYAGTDSDPNNSSLVLRAAVGGVTVLLTGDAEAVAQQDLLDAGAGLRADVLKIPHHGSGQHQVPAFLAATGARVAIASVGADNPYGHPAASTLGALQGWGAQVYRTDRNGSVAVVPRAGRLDVVTERGAAAAPRAVALTAGPTARATMEPWPPRRAPARPRSPSSSATRRSLSTGRSRRWWRPRAPPTPALARARTW